MTKKATLTNLRELKQLTQEQLAQKSGISVRTIVSYENDQSKLRKASYENLKSIANVLNVSVDDIFLEDISVFLKLPNHSKITQP